MAFVQRDELNAIVGVYANPQEGFALEELADDNPELLAFLDAPRLRKEAWAARMAELDADTARQQILAALRDHPEAIETWVRNQINADGAVDLASARQCLKRIETAIVMIAKAMALTS